MFITTDFGIPRVVASLEAPRYMNVLAYMRRNWEHCFAFDAHQRYRCVPLRQLKIGSMQRLLAHLVYNPMTDVTFRYEPVGSYALREIIAEVEKGLEHDDDIIQQWFGADAVLRLLRAANTFDEMADAVLCVSGGFETDPRLRAIVEHVLGSEILDSET